MSLKDFQIVSKLGEGAYSSVYKVIRHEDQKLYALKRVKIFSLSQKQHENALNQIRILASIRHPNIVSYKQAFVDEGTKSLCIVMQYANYGDLAYRINEKQKKGSSFTQTQIWDFFIQIVKGLNQLHKLNIFHRDIKAANIFLNDQGTFIQTKLGDMNVSKISEKGLCITQTGTPFYASPEVWKDLSYDYKSDIWSLGCVLYEMITLKPPFRSEDMEGLYKKVVRGIYPRIPQQYSSQLSSMVRSLLQVNPDSRPTSEKILKMPVIVRKINELSHQVNNEPSHLIRTIRPGQTFVQLQQSLPKPNYIPIKNKKQKIHFNMIATIQQKNTMVEVESLPALEKDKEKVKSNQKSDRLYLKNKQILSMVNRDRKKSEMAIEKPNKVALEINKNSSQHINEKDFKLPKVHNRYNRDRQKSKMVKQNSLRTHKLYN